MLRGQARLPGFKSWLFIFKKNFFFYQTTWKLNLVHGSKSLSLNCCYYVVLNV